MSGESWWFQRTFASWMFTLNLQQLKAVHHVYEGKDVLGKSQI